jgi:hypothetical protein
LLLLLGGFRGLPASGAETVAYSGCCDASAAAPINAELFAAASDEGSLLQLYRRGAGGAAVRSVSVSSFLGMRPKREADLEGAARLGNLVYWVGSHSRNKEGAAVPERQVLFATAIRGTGPLAELVPVGKPCVGLLAALGSDPALKEFELGRAAGLPGEAKGGLNIEGLAAGPGGALWIAFRNPVPLGMALVVPLLNPGEVIEGRPPRLGPALRLDLEGLGIRDIARAGDRYVVVAGPAEGGGRHRLFAWSGDARAPVEIRKGFPRGFAAEGLVVDDLPGARTVEVLSDEGNASIGGKPCEDLRDIARRVFHGVTVGVGGE